jgi:hypothetical protein
MRGALLIAALAAAATAAAQGMLPNKEPVPSPSDLRGATGEDRPQGQAREARTPSPSDLATERPRVDGDRPTSAIQDPRAATGGSAAYQSSREDNRGQPLPAR